MADTKKATTQKEETVRFRLKRNPDPRASQTEFYSHNFKNYLVKRGEWVELPKVIYDMIMEQEEAEDYAADYANEHSLREPGV